MEMLSLLRWSEIAELISCHTRKLSSIPHLKMLTAVCVNFKVSGVGTLSTANEDPSYSPIAHQELPTQNRNSLIEPITLGR